MSELHEIELALACERYELARSLLPQDESPARDLHLARIMLGLGEGSPLEALRLSERAAERLATPESRLPALEVAHEAALRCRLRKSAERLLDTLRALLPEASRTCACEGQLALAFDEREPARRVLSRAHAADPECLHVRLTFARLEYIEGHFEKALGLLEPFLERDRGAQLGPALRLTAACQGARGDHAAEAHVLARLLTLRPDGVRAGVDRLELAFAHAGRGDYESAALELRRLYEAAPESGLGRYARRRLDHLEAESGGESARRLPQFPTTHQKRNFCGPAVLELCLRHLGIELTQDEIAGVVKRERGTPMYEITSFLEAREIVARRIEAKPESVRAAIDLGLPVIVQEEYSTTSHVAVITGYDARLGAFIAQDPMTHRHELKAYEWTERAGYLFGNGGIVVVGRKSAVDEARLAELDRVGLVREPHLAILDDADRRRASASGEGEDALNDEVLEACERALKAAPGYPLAWARRGFALYGKWRAQPSPKTRHQLLDVLQRSRMAFRGAEWAHRLHAAYLSADGRTREAYVELLEAHRADPGDAHQLDEMGDCLRRLGELAEAERRFLEALEKDPTHTSAAENLAALYVSALGTDEQAPWYDPKLTLLAPPPELPKVSTTLPHAREELEQRARFYTELVCRERSESPHNLFQAALYAALTGDLTAAWRAFRACAELRDGPTVRSYEARAALLSGELELAGQTAMHMVSQFAASPTSWLWRAEMLSREGDDEHAYEALAEGVRRVGSERGELVSALWELGTRFGGDEAAAVRLRDIVAEAPHDPAFVRAVATQVDDEGQRGTAIELLRATLALEPGDIQVRYRLGSLLAEDPTSHQEAQALLAEVVRQAPSAGVARQALAWTYWESEPARGLSLLEPALEEAGPQLLETAGVLAQASGEELRGAELRARALGAYETRERGRVALAMYHMQANRYDLAAELVLPIRDVTQGVEREVLERAVLTAARLAGRQLELLEWVAARTRDGVPEHLAWETYWSYRYSHPALAAQAADVRAAREEDPEERLECRINAASCRAKLGELGPLHAIAEEPGLSGKAWAHLYFAYDGARQYGPARQAVERARALAPFDLYCLSAWESFCLDEGDVEGAIGAARSALERHPFQHLGDERLAIIYARQGELSLSLAHSARAVRLAPFCHHAQASRALALFVADDCAGAERHAARARGLEPGQPDEWSDAEAILRALRGDLSGLAQLFEQRAARVRRWPFADFDARLRKVALARK